MLKDPDFRSGSEEKISARVYVCRFPPKTRTLLDAAGTRICADRRLRLDYFSAHLQML